MLPDRFATERLNVHSWRDVIGDRAGRARLEAGLRDILTPPVLDPLPPALALGDEPAAVSDWIDARAGEAELWLVELAGTGELAGLLILARDPGAAKVPQVHIGYLFGTAFWGRGLASELVAGLVGAVTGPVRLVGGVDRENPASARVLRKAGFERDGGMSEEGVDVFVREVPGVPGTRGAPGVPG